MVLARAWRWQRMLESGEHATLAELADAERISRSYVSRVVRLTLLAPDIVERILDGRPTAGLADFLKPFPVEWEKQRERFPEIGLLLDRLDHGTQLRQMALDCLDPIEQVSLEPAQRCRAGIIASA